MDFLNQVGTQKCRDDLKAFQQRLLIEPKRSAMLSRMQALAQDKGVTYNLLGQAAAYEDMVRWIRFSAWMTMDPSFCASMIPSAMATDDEDFTFFDAVSDVASQNTDATVTGDQPYYYQGASQLGTPGIDDSYLNLTVNPKSVD